MSDRRQLNIRLDKEPELYEAIKDQAHRLDMSISAFIIMALKSSLDWQIPFDAPALLRRTQDLEKAVRDLTLWKEEAELEIVQNKNDHGVELDNLKKRLAILEHAYELERLKHDPVVGEQLIADFLEKHGERVKNELISQEKQLSDFIEKHRQRFKNDPVATERVVDEFLERHAERQLISQEDAPITQVNEEDSQDIDGTKDNRQ